MLSSSAHGMFLTINTSPGLKSLPVFSGGFYVGWDSVLGFGFNDLVLNILPVCAAQMHEVTGKAVNV